MITKKYDEVTLKIFETKEELGREAAKEAAQCILKCLGEKEEISCVFAAAPSQNEFLKALIEEHQEIPWNRIHAFHMDEYVGLEKKDPRSFGNFLSRTIFDKVPFLSVDLINGLAEIEGECMRYGELLTEQGIDIVFMGIGENGHIAFNDPGVADFLDSRTVKEVELEEACKIQQVNDGCFKTILDVPNYAITLTIPTLINSSYVFCIVPNIRKANAVALALNGIIKESCPASILRTKPGTRMYIDKESASEL